MGGLALAAGLSGADILSKLFGGSSAKTDRKTTIMGYGDLQKLFNYGMGEGQNQENQGSNTENTALNNLDPAAAYYRSLLTGNRSAVLQAVAPTVTAANAQADAQKRQIATSGTGRGGGVNAVGQQINTNTQSTIDNAINEARGGAAKGITGVAGEEGAIGATQLSQAARLLGISTQAAGDLTADSIHSRPESFDENRTTSGDVGTDVGNIVKMLSKQFGH